MRLRLLTGAATAAALLTGLAACGTTASSTAFTDFAKTIASDPHCGHTDRVQGNLGGLTGNNLAVYLERTCPAPVQPAAAPPPATPPT